jgi:hypothetical protein
MAERKFYIGSVGPYLYDDTDLINDPDGDFPGEGMHTLVTNHQMIVNESPSQNEHLMRLGDSNERLLAPMAVVNIADPSIELGAVGGTVGTMILIYQIDGGMDERTLYEWETANVSGADIPYVIAGLTGFWIATAGRYSNGIINGGDF